MRCATRVQQAQRCGFKQAVLAKGPHQSSPVAPATLLRTKLVRPAGSTQAVASGLLLLLRPAWLLGNACMHGGPPSTTPPPPCLPLVGVLAAACQPHLISSSADPSRMASQLEQPEPCTMTTMSAGRTCRRRGTSSGGGGGVGCGLWCVRGCCTLTLGAECGTAVGGAEGHCRLAASPPPHRCQVVHGVSAERGGPAAGGRRALACHVRCRRDVKRFTQARGSSHHSAPCVGPPCTPRLRRTCTALSSTVTSLAAPSGRCCTLPPAPPSSAGAGWCRCGALSAPATAGRGGADGAGVWGNPSAGSAVPF